VVPLGLRCITGYKACLYFIVYTAPNYTGVMIGLQSHSCVCYSQDIVELEICIYRTETLPMSSYSHSRLHMKVQ
jgi:hypothetical protein